MYHFTHNDQKTPDNTQVHRSLQNCGSQYGCYLMSTFWHLEFGRDSKILGKFVDLCFRNIFVLPYWTQHTALINPKWCDIGNTEHHTVRFIHRCPGRNVPDFGRMFLTLKYTDITQNTYVRSWTVTEIMAREVWKYDSCYTLTDYQIHIKTARNM